MQDCTIYYICIIGGDGYIYTTNVVLLLIVTTITIYKMKRKIAFQGAEARVYESKILGKKMLLCNKSVIQSIRKNKYIKKDLYLVL